MRTAAGIPIARDMIHQSIGLPGIPSWSGNAHHEPVHGDGEPGAWDGLIYYRLHGAPKTYYSDYDQTALDGVAERLSKIPAVDSWCIFDNTAAGAALENALSIEERVRNRGGSREYELEGS
jgi:hypothetical protein